AYPSRCVSPSVLIPQPPVPTLFPYTTLFRSPDDDYLDVRDAERMAVRPTGTINCDCVTPAGDVSSVTTTSGLAFKVPGRVGDSPIVGAGQYTDNDIGAAGSTGRGESNIKVCGGFLTVEHMRRGMKPQDAC